MSLDKTLLESRFLPLFSTPPSTIAACATAWASAMEEYALPITPTAQPAQVYLAASNLESTLASIFTGNDSESMIPLLEAAFKSFGNTVGFGITLNGWITTAPPGLVGFQSLFGTFAETHEKAAENFASLIDTWMKTGVSVRPPPSNEVAKWL